jgi:1-acyl-sn-glycerol-3-phosphate acyltransferase
MTNARRSVKPDTLAVARRLVRIVGAFLFVWIVARLIAPWLGAARRQRLVGRLSGGVLAVMGVRLETRGAAATGPVLVVANHVSWLDVQVLNAVRSLRFVAKSETRRWPICGGIAAGFDTIFLERGNVRDAARVKARVASALAAGQSVAVFPEGTTTDGRSLGRFYAALFEAAIEAGVPVQPIALRYPRADGAANPAAAFVDDMTFLESLLLVAREPRLVARLTFAPAIDTSTRCRRRLAAQARRAIAEALDLPAVAAATEHVARFPPESWRTRPRRDRPAPPVSRPTRPPRLPVPA